MAYEITVNLPTGKELVEVAGLGVFENGKTTLLTDEQEYRWFNRTGANPLANFPEGITVKEVGRQQKPTTEKKQASPDGGTTPAKPADGKGEA